MLPKVSGVFNTMRWLAVLAALLTTIGAGAQTPLRYRIVVTGGELLEGVYPDGHTPFLTRTLRHVGGQCIGSLTVDDNREDIQRALRFATNGVELVLVTGGLGPTPNDITRETLAEFTGIPLREDASLIADMEKRFSQSREQLRANLRRQTLIPARGRYLKNLNGTAAGLVFETGTGLIVALPGPPRELQPMVRDELIPFLRQRFELRDFGTSLTLRFVGAGQSLIDQTIKDHVQVAPEVVITSLFEGSRVDFTFSLPGQTAENMAKLKRLESSIREHLEQYVYADDGASLEEVVLRAMRAKGGRLVLAEIGSGGAVSAALNAARESALVLSRAYVAPEERAMAEFLQVRLNGTKGPPESIQELTAAAVAKVNCEWGAGIGPVQLEADGTRFVWAVFHLPGGRWERQRFALRDAGEISRTTLTTQVLDFLRKQMK